MKFSSVVIAVLLASCGAENSSDLFKAWNQNNDPKNMGLDYFKESYQYQNNFSKLPLAGDLSKTPWSGDYWATFRGGITFRWVPVAASWEFIDDKELAPFYGYELLPTDKEKLDDVLIHNLSPAEKYDLYLGDYTFSLTRFERERTQVMKTIESSSEFDPDFEIPRWEGLCHAWAPATLQYEAPSNVVVTNPDGIEIPFGASDIKALLTYNLHHNESLAGTKFLGSRCELNVDHLTEQLQNGKITQAEYRKQYRSILKTSACADTNAGAFHITLANQIALMDEGFVVDVTRDSEVWNQGVYSFESEVLRESKKVLKSSAKGTVKRIFLKTTMKYVNEISFSWQGEVASEDQPEGIKVYHYWLELDAQNEIVGGEWAKPKEIPNQLEKVDADEKDDRPDFLWKMETVPFANGFQELEQVYLKSIAK